jgi:hypothetical protein
MTFSVAPGQTAIYTVLTTFIKSLITCELVQGLGNGVATPDAPFIAMTAVALSRLSTNISTYDAAGGVRSVMMPTQYSVQIDCYGPDSSDWATILVTMFRDPYGCDLLAPTAQPLYCDDPKMMPLVDAEENYEQRWMITAVLQFNPIVTVSQEFMNTIDIVPVSVDATFPA